MAARSTTQAANISKAQQKAQSLASKENSKRGLMANVNDKQIDTVLFHGGTAHQEIHTPAGKIPTPASDAPIVSGKIVAFSAGKQIAPLTVTLTNGTRIANPA